MAGGSCFTKVNQIKANGGAAFQNKENQEVNQALSSNHDSSSEGGSDRGSEITQKQSIERRIRRFLSHMKNKLNSIAKDHKTSRDTNQVTLMRWEEFVRGMDPEEQEKYLAEQEQNYQYNNTEESDKSEIEHRSEKQDKDDIESISAISEIPQEQIIMMTNLSSLIPTEASSFTIKETKSKLKSHAINKRTQKQLQGHSCKIHDVLQC